MEHPQVVVIGGSSGIGLGIAGRLLADGANVTIAARSADRLAAAERELGAGERLRTIVTDVSQEGQVERLFASTGPVDHIVCTAVDAVGAYQPIRRLDLTSIQKLVNAKLYGALLIAKHGTARGSITYTSGIAAYRPAAGGSVVAAVNGALGSLAAALAIELAPVRVNAISPGWVDTPVWDAIAGDAKAERLAAMAARLPAGRIGSPADIAEAVLALVHNGFITGTVLHVDGGHRLV
ncbi:SDR family oxidoreductase [Fodinicola feengrottensis]